MKTISQLINEGAEAIRTGDAKTCGDCGNAIVASVKGELDALKWPDIPDEEWTKINQNARKLLIASSLFPMSEHSGPEKTLTA